MVSGRVHEHLTESPGKLGAVYVDNTSRLGLSELKFNDAPVLYSFAILYSAATVRALTDRIHHTAAATIRIWGTIAIITAFQPISICR